MVSSQNRIKHMKGIDTMAVKNNWEHLTGCDWARLLQFQPEIENCRVRFSRSFGSI